MATVKDDLANWTLDDLLEAINPAPPTLDERIQRALAVVDQYHREGQLSDAEAEGLVRVLLDAGIAVEIGEIVTDYFTPHHRQQRRNGRSHFLALQ